MKRSKNYILRRGVTPIILHRGQFRIRAYTSSLFQSSDADDDSRNMNWKEVYLMRTKLCKYTCGMEQQHHGVRHWAVLSSPVLLSPSRSVAQSSHLLGLLRLHPPPSICQQHIHELKEDPPQVYVFWFINLLMYQDEEGCTDPEAEIFCPQEMLRKIQYFFAHREIQSMVRVWEVKLTMSTTKLFFDGQQCWTDRQFEQRVLGGRRQGHVSVY